MPEARDVERELYLWKSKYGGMGVSDAQKLRGLEAENAKLKRLLADAMLDNVAATNANLC